MAFLTESDWQHNESDRDDLQREMRAEADVRHNGPVEPFTRLPKCLEGVELGKAMPFEQLVVETTDNELRLAAIKYKQELRDKGE